MKLDFIRKIFFMLPEYHIRKYETESFKKSSGYVAHT